jgi:hypothetical protein
VDEKNLCARFYGHPKTRWCFAGCDLNDRRFLVRSGPELRQAHRIEQVISRQSGTFLILPLEIPEIDVTEILEWM